MFGLMTKSVPKYLTLIEVSLFRLSSNKILSSWLAATASENVMVMPLSMSKALSKALGLVLVMVRALSVVRGSNSSLHCLVLAVLKVTCCCNSL